MSSPPGPAKTIWMLHALIGGSWLESLAVKLVSVCRSQNLGERTISRDMLLSDELDRSFDLNAVETQGI